MGVTGPHYDKRKGKRGQPRCWYLSVSKPAVTPDGTPILNEKGRVKRDRSRPHYYTKALAAADIRRLEEQTEVAGSSERLLGRDEMTEFHQAKRVASEVSLVELAKFWRTHHPLGQHKTIAELVPIFLKQTLDRLGATKHTQDLKQRLAIYTAKFGDRYPGSMRRKELLDWLATKPSARGLPASGRSVLNLKNSICTFHNWLIDEEVVAKNPIDNVRRHLLPHVDKAEPAYLTLAYVESYMRALERYDPEMIAHEVVQLFAGVRADDEMANFRAEWVNYVTKEIVVPASAAKTKVREVLNNIEPVFFDWWAEWVFTHHGYIRPRNYRARWSRVRTLAVLQAKDQARADELALLPIREFLKLPEVAETVKQWPWNARRRTFCSYHVNLHQSADRTALLLRHRGPVSTLLNSYLGQGLTQKDGEKYFSIKPILRHEPAVQPEVMWTPIRGRKAGDDARERYLNDDATAMELTRNYKHLMRELTPEEEAALHARSEALLREEANGIKMTGGLTMRMSNRGYASS